MGYRALGHKESAMTEAREHSMHGNAYAPVKTDVRIGIPYYYLRLLASSLICIPTEVRKITC